MAYFILQKIFKNQANSMKSLVFSIKKDNF